MRERLLGDGLAAEGTCGGERGGELGGAGEAGVVLVGTQHHGGSFLAVELEGTYATGEAVTFLCENGQSSAGNWVFCPLSVGVACAVAHLNRLGNIIIRWRRSDSPPRRSSAPSPSIIT